MSQEVAVYRKHMNLKLAANELGISWQTLYCRLKRLGEPVIGEGTASLARGRLAMSTAYERQLARVRAYNKTPRGREVKRAARLRQVERERAAKAEIRMNTGPLTDALAHWRH